MNKIKKHFSHFQNKLLLAFILCTFIPLCMIGGVSYAISYSIARDKIMDSAILTADQLHVQLNYRIRQAEDVADAIQFNMYTLSSNYDKSLSSHLDSLTSLRNNISLYKTTFNFYHICLFFKEGELGNGEGLSFFPLEDMKNYRIGQEALSDLGASSLWIFRPKVRLPFILDTGQRAADTVICCRAQHNQRTGRLDYAYFILIDTNEFSDLLSAAFSSTEISSYIVTPDGYPAAYSREELKKRKESDVDPLLLNQDHPPYFKVGDAYCHVKRLDNGWYQITEIPQSYITSSTAVLIRSILLTLLATLPVTMLVILLIARNLSRRISILSQAMESFRLRSDGSTEERLLFSRPSDSDLYDEIDTLGLTFEQMQETIQKNLKSILDLSLTEERLKYQLLQSQINPHFLYNILGSIRTCQTLGKLDTANQMITDLTKFYRLTLRRSGELITLRDELEIASLYLNMEKLCHNSSLTWAITLEDGIDNFMICKFTLQPFLENCILHGISVDTPDLFIQINALYGDDTVIIELKDNGTGIQEDRLKELRRDLENKVVNYEKHFGICNVNARISSELYGHGHIEIESLPLRGTSITIEFAQMEGEIS